MNPKLTVPPGACDTHVHIFPPEALARSGANAAVADLSQYLDQRSRLGIERTVLVQPSAFRFDNSAMLDALARLGPSGRGVAMVEPSADDNELRRLTALGVRGARLHLLKNPLQSWDDVAPVVEKVTPHGWHVQIQCDGRQLPDHAAALADLGTTLVIDQTAKFVEPVGTGDPAFRALLDLVGTGRVYVKLSAPYEVSRTGPPDYEDVGALARLLADTFPDRMLWASNWPHTFFPADRKPDDAALLGLLADWAPEEATRRKILVDNPARLYGF